MAVHACVFPILELFRFWIFCILFQVVISSSNKTHFIIWLDSLTVHAANNHNSIFEPQILKPGNPWCFRLPAFTIPFVVTSWAFLLFSTGNGVVVRFSSIHIRNQYRHCQTLKILYKYYHPPMRNSSQGGRCQKMSPKKPFTSGRRALWRRNSGLLPWGKSRTRRSRTLSSLLQVRTRLQKPRFAYLIQFWMGWFS